MGAHLTEDVAPPPASKSKYLRTAGPFQMPKLDGLTIQECLDQDPQRRELLGPEVLQQLKAFQAGPEVALRLRFDTKHVEVPAGEREQPYLLVVLLALITRFFGKVVGYEERDAAPFAKNIFSGDGQSSQSHVAPCEGLPEGQIYGDHTENVTHPYVPEVVTMLCVQQDREKTAETLLFPNAAVVEMLTPQALWELQQPQYKMRLDENFDMDKKKGWLPSPAPVLWKDQERGQWWSFYDRGWTYPAASPGQKDAAQLEYERACAASVVDVKLEAGDVLIWKNLEATHDVRHRGSGRRLLRLHALPADGRCLSPFKEFQELPPPEEQFLERFLPGAELNVLRSRGLYAELLGKEWAACKAEPEVATCEPSEASHLEMSEACSE